MKTNTTALAIAVTVSLSAHAPAGAIGIGKRYKEWKTERALKASKRRIEKEIAEHAKPKQLTELEQFDKDHPPKRPFSQAVNHFRTDMVQEMEKSKHYYEYTQDMDIMDVAPDKGDVHAQIKYRIPNFLNDPESIFFVESFITEYFRWDIGSEVPVKSDLEYAQDIAKVMNGEMSFNDFPWRKNKKPDLTE